MHAEIDELLCRLLRDKANWLDTKSIVSTIAEARPRDDNIRTSNCYQTPLNAELLFLMAKVLNHTIVDYIT